MEKTLDPRIVRTRRLIMDAFMQLATEKKFKDITIKDITTLATVNRATFYYHFFDKNDLLEVVIKDDVLQGVFKNATMYESLSVQLLEEILFSLLSFQSNLSNQCSKSYEAFTPKLETLIKEELSRILRELLKEQFKDWSFEKIELKSIMISWTLYGISTKYVQSQDKPTSETLDSIFSTLIM